MERSKSLSNTLNDVKYEQYINNLHDRLPSLIDPNEIDCNRWPWELVQNAKDTVVKRKSSEQFVDVKFIYYKDEFGKEKLCFEHNGDQFTDKAITGLIWKFSAEKRNEQFTEDGLSRDKQSTGRFGTGFMTTHALSLTVDVSGSYYNGDPGVERNVSVEFTLHREGPTDEDYKIGVKRTEDEMAFDRIPITEGDILPTKFIYHLKNDINRNAAETGLENVRLNAAQTMLFCPTVRSIIVDDKINNTFYKIIRKVNSNDWGNIIKGTVKETVFEVESSNIKDCKERHFISVEIEEKSEALSSFWYPNERNLRLHVAVEVDKNKNILTIPSTTPSVYCSLPLIGYERMCLPFYVNSNDFEPITERTSLYLNQRRSKVDYDQDKNQDVERVVQNGVNWSILERSVSLYEEIVDYLIENDYSQRYNLVFGLSQVLRNSWTDEEKNCLAARFILPIRTMLMSKELVKTQSGYCNIKSGVKFIECAKDKERDSFYDICTSIYDLITTEEENQQWVDLKWSKYRFSQGFEEKPEDEDDNPEISTIKYEDVATYIEEASTYNNLKLVDEIDKLEWLNKFYLWIFNAKLPILSEKAIVPNRKGDFCSCESGCDLRDGSDIPTNIFEFLKTIDIDWDEHLLMDGITNVALTKETTDNVTAAIKDKTKEIKDRNDDVLTNLLPILLALPAENNNNNSIEFRKKREKIISILSTMYRKEIEGKDRYTLDLKSPTWELADKWFINNVAEEIAERSKLDTIEEGDSEETIKDKYCTSSWLSDTINFMFDENYLHQDNITDGNPNSLAIIPNRYGDFKFVNELYLQDLIPDELLDNTLADTGFDIMSMLIYKDFDLSRKITVSKYTISTIASIYNDFFDSDADEICKENVSRYLLHLIPECGEQYANIRRLYDKYKGSTVVENKIISTSDLIIWKGAKNYMIKFLANKASEQGSIKAIGSVLVGEIGEQKNHNEYVALCHNEGLEWLNSLTSIISKNNINVDDLCVVPDIYGVLHKKSDMIYDGAVLSQYENYFSLIKIIDGELWKYYEDSEKEEGDEGITATIVHRKYVHVNNYQNNTDEKVFGLVNRLIEYCCNNESGQWRNILKSAISVLLRFFEENEGFMQSNSSKLSKLFPTMYRARKELSYDYIYDADTKARISRINENFSPEEIENLINEKETIKNILSKKDYYTNLEEENQKLVEQIEELSGLTDIIRDCTSEQLDQVKQLVEQLATSGSFGTNGNTPTGGDDRVVPKVELVPETYEIEVVDYQGHIQHVKTDQVQYAGLSLEEIEQYVSEAKAAVVKYFRELNDRENLGLQFDKERIGSYSYSQLYGISDRDGKEIPLVVHSYKGPQYRFFDLNWYDWQVLSKPGSMLWVLTVTGLQCIPLYALPIRNFNFSLDSSMSNESRAALLTLAQVGKQYNQISFDFGNNMPHGFTNPIAFDYVPKELKDSVDSIKQVCDSSLSRISGIYNNARNIPITHSLIGYSRALKETDPSETQREIFESAPNDTKPPVVATTFID